MIRKVNIYLNGDSLVRFFDEETEQAALNECNKFLAEHDASDGKTMMSFEDEAGVNAHLAEKYNDPINEDYYIELSNEFDGRCDALIYIADNIGEFNWPETLIKKILTEMGVFCVK